MVGKPASSLLTVRLQRRKVFAPRRREAVGAGRRTKFGAQCRKGYMGRINIEQLLAPISEAEPSGPNLEYDPAFSELERGVQGKPEQRLGNVHVPFEPPDWSAVCKQSLALLERTRDLRVAMHLALGQLHCDGLVGFADGIELAAGLVSNLWPSVHPEVDHEDDDDPTMRVTALAILTAPPTLLALQKCPLAQLRGLGKVSLNEIQAAASGTAQGDSVMSSATVEAIFHEVEFEALEATVSGVQRCLDGVAAIDGAFVTHAGGRGPDLSPLTQLLREVRQALKPRLDARQVAKQGDELEPQGDVPGAAAAGGNPSRVGGALSGEIRSREDVLKAIDMISAYYSRAEPASPLPLLLERCRRLAKSSFLEIIKELVPDGVAQVNNIAGRKPE
jgi:type VI secretion system protein ImpA